jgi:hypothetical protein
VGEEDRYISLFDAGAMLADAAHATKAEKVQIQIHGTDTDIYRKLKKINTDDHQS